MNENIKDEMKVEDTKNINQDKDKDQENKEDNKTNIKDKLKNTITTIIKVTKYIYAIRFNVIICIILMTLMLYVFNLLFGDKSLTILMNLEEKEQYLKERVKYLQKQNSILQKEIFELSHK